MKAKIFLATIMLLACACMASAQGYAIRIANNTNLRLEKSLEAPVVVSARAGEILRVLAKEDRWLRVERKGKQLWMAGWVSYRRVEETETIAPGPAPAQTQVQTDSHAQPAPVASAAAAEIDNCCFIDRQCQSEQDWQDGFWAFRAGQCPASAQTHTQTPTQTQAQTQTPAQPVSAAEPAANPLPAVIDNCCFAGWQCQTDEQWRNGYEAFQQNLCPTPAQSAPSINIDISADIDIASAQVDNCCRVNRQCQSDLDWQRGFAAYQFFQCRTAIPIQVRGTPHFSASVRAAFQLLQDQAPRLFAYAIRGLDVVEEVAAEGVIGVYVDKGLMVFPNDLAQPDEASQVFLAGSLVHEACHVLRWEAGIRQAMWKEEQACVSKGLEAVLALDPDDRFGFVSWHRDLLANLHNPQYWWWAD